MQGTVQDQHLRQIVRRGLAKDGTIHIKNRYAVFYRDIALTVFLFYLLDVFRKCLIGRGLLVPALEIASPFVHGNLADLGASGRINVTDCPKAYRSSQHKGKQFFLTQFHNSHPAVQSNCRFGILQTIHYENFDYL